MGIVAAVATLGPGRLQLKRDYFLVAVIAQAAIYLFIVPAADLIGADSALAINYERFQFLALVLFFIPTIILYRAIVPRLRTRRPYATVEIGERRAIVFALFLLLFEVLFLIVAVRNDMLFRRIGTYVIAERQAGLDPLSLFIIRSHDLVSLPLLGYLWFLQIRFRQGMSASPFVRRLLLGTTTIMAAVFVVTAVVSSRGTVLIAAVFLFGTYYMFSSRKLGVAVLRAGLPLAVVAIYLTTLVPNIRVLRSTSDSLVQALNPTYVIERTQDQPEPPAVVADPRHAQLEDLPPAQRAVARYLRSEWISRLDCLSLMELMEPSLQKKGYENGRAWAVPALIATTQFVAPQLTIEYKRTARTTAKSYLLAQHTQLDPGDYYSCSVTDLYGNFGFAGFLLGAIVLAVLFALLARVLLGGLPFGTQHSYLLGLILAAHLAVFEQEFITYLVGWIRDVPITAILLLLNPVKVRTPARSTSVVSAHDRDYGPDPRRSEKEQDKSRTSRRPESHES